MLRLAYEGQNLYVQVIKWEYDFFLDLAAETAGVEQMDITSGASLWLRNTWGYFWKEM